MNETEKLVTKNYSDKFKIFREKIDELESKRYDLALVYEMLYDDNGDFLFYAIKNIPGYITNKEKTIFINSKYMRQLKTYKNAVGKTVISLTVKSGFSRGSKTFLVRTLELEQ